MQTLATSHPIHRFLAEGLRTRTAAVKHRTNIENALQQFPITTTRINPIARFTQPPWHPVAGNDTYEIVNQINCTAYAEKSSRIKQIKKATHEQWADFYSKAPLSRLRRILQRNGNQHGPALYNKLSRNTCAKVIQLRTGHCGLNSYLHRFGLADSPLCECKNGQETVEHFLLECPLHREQRRELREKAGTEWMHCWEPQK